MLVGSILYGADEQVKEFVRQRIPGTSRFDDAVALGVVRNGVLIAGCVFTRFMGHDIEVSTAADDARWATRRNLDHLFGYPFRQLDCVRMTAVTSEANVRTRKFLQGIGFKEEGRARKGWDGQLDAIIFGILKDECRFLRTPENG